MSTAHETAALLPGPDQLRTYLRALAVLDTAIGDDPRFCQYTFDGTWGPGVEAALMENGSGDVTPRATCQHSSSTVMTKGPDSVESDPFPSARLTWSLTSSDRTTTG
ncbi:hypothetical protein ACWD0Z_38440 [Streptomyces sp. NPDC003007]